MRSRRLSIFATLAVTCLGLVTMGQAQIRPRPILPGADALKTLTLALRKFNTIPRKLNETVPGYIKIRLTPAQAKDLFNTRRREGKFVIPGMERAVMRSRVYNSNWTIWKLPPGQDVKATTRQLMASRVVSYAEPLNKIYPLIPTPNDPDFSVIETTEPMVLLGDNVEFRRLWYLDDVSAMEAWNDYPGAWSDWSEKTGTEPTIAVIDTGCDVTHPDFANGGDDTDILNGGQIDFARSGYFTFGAYESGPIEDSLGHGTHVAGLAFASGNNGASFEGKGMIGLGHNSQSMILRVFDDTGNGSDADAAAAILYAADNGADIINLSLGTTSYSQLFQDAVTYAWQKGILVVCASNENGAGGGDLGPIYPAACSGSLAVTANGPGYAHASDYYAGTGSYLCVAAPGGNAVIILDPENPVGMYVYMYSTTMRTDNPIYHAGVGGEPPPGYGLGYGYLVGTSMACPVVAGSAGLYYGKTGIRAADGWANLRAFRAIERSAIGVYGAPKGSWENTQGFGSLDSSLLLADEDTRAATAGSIMGIVYNSQVATPNVPVKAQLLSGGTIFNTTTRADGTYRYDQLPPGEFKIYCTVGGTTKTKRATVVPGTDQPGTDFYVNGVDDATAPIVPYFHYLASQGDTIQFTHWGYDTESGIDKVTIRIGTTPGGTEVVGDTEVTGTGPVIYMPPVLMKDGGQYYATAKYTNGAGLVTTSESVPFKRLSQTYNAAFISQTTPSSVVKNASFSASLKFRNTGGLAWAAGGRNRFSLVAENPTSTTRWGRPSFPLSPGSVVETGEDYTFLISLTAPATAGTYDFQWALYRNGVRLGPVSANVRLRVTN